MWTQIISIIAGAFIMLTPYLWDYDQQLSNHNYIIGPLIITFAITAIWEVNRNARWANIPLAAWLVIFTFVFGEAHVIWPNLVSSAIVIICAAIKRKGKDMYGGGWKSLFQKNAPHVQAANNSTPS
jgi:hypothetical protein